MHLIPPSKGRRKWRIRFQNFDGVWRVVQAYDDHNGTIRLSQRIISLVSARLNGDPPPQELAPWIAAMDPKLADRLTELGLLDRRRRQQAKPIASHVDDYEKHVGARRNNSTLHGQEMASKVRRLCTELKIDVFADISANDVEVKLKDLSLSSATMRSYLVAMRDFCGWMVRDKRAMGNPMEAVVLPKSVAKTERKPYTVEEFQKLMKHLATVDRYPHQLAAWTGADRRLLYWTAVKTAFRLNVLRELTVSHLVLDAKPAAIKVPAWLQKNKTAHQVPIPADLAQALKVYCEKKLPGTRVFPIAGIRATVEMLRRDLKAAGIDYKWEGTTQTRDFHTFRHTAITWWLQVDGLDQLSVQRLAGLKTLAMVQRYSRGFSMDATPWLDKGPLLDVQPEEQAKTG